MANLTITENDTTTLIVEKPVRPTTARVLTGTTTGTDYLKGTLLSWNTTSDKFEVYDGTGDIAGILDQDVAGETGVDKDILPYVGGVFDVDKLLIQGGGSIGAAEEVLMQKSGLYFKDYEQLAKLDNNNA